MRRAMGRLRERYGASPLHLLAMLCCLALVAYAALLTTADSRWPLMLVWFVGALIGHDLLLYPLYAVADRSLTQALRRRRRVPSGRPRLPAVNYVRVPAMGAGLTFLLFLPGIVRQGAETYHNATGQTQSPFLGRWLLLCAAMFGISALVYAVHVGRAARAQRPR